MSGMAEVMNNNVNNANRQFAQGTAEEIAAGNLSGQMNYRVETSTSSTAYPVTSSGYPIGGGQYMYSGPVEHSQRNTSVTYVSGQTPVIQSSTRSRGVSTASVGGMFSSYGGAKSAYAAQQFNGSMQQATPVYTSSARTISGMTGPANIAAGTSSGAYSSRISGATYSAGGAYSSRLLAGATGSSSALTPTGMSGMMTSGAVSSAITSNQVGASPVNVSSKPTEQQWTATSTHRSAAGSATAGIGSRVGPSTGTVASMGGYLQADRSTRSHATSQTGNVYGNTVITGSSQQQVQLTGREVVVGVNTYVDESRTVVVGERVTEQEVRVPKKIVREDIIERTYVVPEKVVHEQITEEVVKVRQRVIELAKPVIHEKIVEVPEVVTVEKIVEVPEIITQEKVREVVVPSYEERVVEVPRAVYVEKIVEVPQTQYVDVPVDKVVEVTEYVEEVRVREVPVPHRVEKPVPEYVNVEEIKDVNRIIPVPVEAIVTVDLKIPQLRRSMKTVEVPLYVPKFIEVPIPVDLMDENAYLTAENFANQVATLAYHQSSAAAGGFLCEFERMGTMLKNLDTHSFVATNPNDITTLWQQAFASGRLQVNNAHVLATQNVATRIIDVNNIMAFSKGSTVTSEQVLTTTTSTASSVLPVTTTSARTITSTVSAMDAAVAGQISGVRVTGRSVPILADGLACGVATTAAMLTTGAMKALAGDISASTSATKTVVEVCATPVSDKSDEDADEEQAATSSEKQVSNDSYAANAAETTVEKVDEAHGVTSKTEEEGAVAASATIA